MQPVIKEKHWCLQSFTLIYCMCKEVLLALIIKPSVQSMHLVLMSYTVLKLVCDHFTIHFFPPNRFEIEMF